MDASARSPDENDREPSDRYWSLLLEVDAALAEARIDVADGESIADLPADECHRLAQARRCLELLYDRNRSFVGRSAPGRPDSRACATTPSLPADFDVARTEPRFNQNENDCEIRGTRLGRFNIIREIGRGGHGVVFLAHDPALQRLVALKVPRPEAILTDSMRRRFIAEGRTAAALTHPNIVTVFEAGELGPICYLAQAYIPGVTLAEWLRARDGQLSPTIAAEIVAQLADGVAHAHARGILHRDIKPSNVLLEFDEKVDESERKSVLRNLDGAPQATNDSEPQIGHVTSTAAELGFTPKLTDFGIAKTLEMDAGETATGAVLGTASYMSPEQAAGQNDRVGRACDVYSLGAVLYELLTRTVVFQGNSMPETLRQVLSADPTPPRKLRPDLLRDLDAICLKCLEKEPRRRYPSAFELAADLRRFLAGEPTGARPVSTVERLVRWAKRKPTAAMLVGVSVLGVTTLLAVCLSYNGRLSRLLVDSEAHRMRAEASERLALDREDLAMEHVYASRIATAQDAWNQGNMSNVEEILSELTPAAGQRDRRSIEWFYLRGLLSNASTRLCGHSGRVAAVAYSPDGAQLASGGKDGSVRLWNAATHESLRVWNAGEKNEINAVAFSPDGQTLAAATDDGTVRLWNFQTGAAKGQLRGHAGWVSDVTFSPDGKSIATAGSDKTVRIWNSKTQRATAVLVGHRDIVRGVRFLGGGALLATTSEDQTVRLWNVATSVCMHEERLHGLKGHEIARPTSLAVSPDGKSLAVCLGAISIWTVTLPPAMKLAGGVYEPGLRCVTFSHDGKALLIGTEDAKVYEWDIATRARVAVRRGHREQILNVAASPRDDEVATASRDGDIRIWAIKSGQPFQTLARLRWVPSAFDLSPGGDFLAAKGNRGEIAVLDAATGALRQEWADSTHQPGGVSYFASGQRLLTDRGGHGCRVWDIATKKPIRDFPDLCSPNGQALPAVEGNMFVAATNDRLELINGETRERLARLQLPSTVSGLAVTADGRHLAVGGHLGQIWICDSHDLHIERQLAAHRDRVAWLVFAHNRPWLCTRSDDYSVRLWNWQTGTSLRTFTNESGSAVPLEFTADDRAVIGATDSAALLIWNSATGRKTFTWQFPGLHHSLLAHISRDGRRLYVLCWFPDEGAGAIYVINIDANAPGSSRTWRTDRR